MITPTTLSQELKTVLTETNSLVVMPVVSKTQTADDIVCLNNEEKQFLEGNTKSQSFCSLWFEAR